MALSDHTHNRKIYILLMTYYQLNNTMIKTGDKMKSVQLVRQIGRTQQIFTKRIFTDASINPGDIVEISISDGKIIIERMKLIKEEDE